MILKYTDYTSCANWMHQSFLLTVGTYSDFTGILYVLQMYSYPHQHTGKTEKVSIKQLKKITPSLPLDIWLSTAREKNMYYRHLAK